MNRLQRLKQERQKLVSRMESMLKKADEESRDFTADEESDFQELEAELQPLNKRIEREEQFLAAQADEEPEGGRVRTTTDDGIGAIRDNWQDDPMCGFAQPRDFLLEVIQASHPEAEVSPQLRFLAAAGSDEQGGYSDPHGGFFVPEGMSPQLLEVGVEGDPTMPTPVPMQSPVVKFNARVDKNHSSSVSGGLTVSRNAETQQPDSSRTKYEQVKLEATGQFGLAYVTEQLLERSPVSFAAILDAGFRTEFSSERLKEKISGTGVGEPLGILNSPCLISVAKESMQSADTINGTNLLKMRARCWNYSRAIWLANHDTYLQLVAAHITGTNTDNYLFTPGNGTDVPDTLLGRPIYFSEYAKTLGDKGDLMLGVWSEYVWGTLGPANPRRAESVHVRFLNHERTFKFWLENDGQPWWNTPLTPVESSTTLSPFVTLDERA